MDIIGRRIIKMGINKGLKWCGMGGGGGFGLWVVCMVGGGLRWVSGGGGWVVLFGVVFWGVVGLRVFKVMKVEKKEDWLGEGGEV